MLSCWGLLHKNIRHLTAICGFNRQFCQQLPRSRFDLDWLHCATDRPSYKDAFLTDASKNRKRIRKGNKGRKGLRKERKKRREKMEREEKKEKKKRK